MSTGNVVHTTGVNSAGSDVVSTDDRLGLLVDFGGVLTTSVYDAFAAFSVSVGADPDAIMTVLGIDPEASKLLVAHECGFIDDEVFEVGLAARLAAHGIDVEPEKLIDSLQAGLSPDEEMLSALAVLRSSGVPVAIVTNSLGRNCYEGFDLPSLADVVVISGHVGVRKPSRRIYELACEGLALDPSQCVLIDDVQVNLDGAARLGIAGVLHVSATQTLAGLQSRFGISTPSTR